MKSPAYWLYRILWESLDWLYPPVCISCKKNGFQICPDCQSLILHMKKPICNICGISIITAGICASCQRIKPEYNILRSWAVFTGPIQKAIHRIKYKRDLSLGIELAKYLSSFIEDMQVTVENVIPVPLGRRRLKTRGYNQVSLIALPLALNLGVKYLPHGLLRIRETESQVGLNIKDRRDNVRDAFRANSRQVSGKNILLIDDVATTGATLSSCTRALKVGGAVNVYVVTLARALTSHGLSVSNDN